MIYFYIITASCEHVLKTIPQHRSGLTNQLKYTDEEELFDTHFVLSENMFWSSRFEKANAT